MKKDIKSAKNKRTPGICTKLVVNVFTIELLINYKKGSPVISTKLTLLMVNPKTSKPAFLRVVILSVFKPYLAITYFSK